ncbi:30S ribosomal protein S13 [Candidatus Woesearchaeota archaeon]|nr:30S ribosomal protein S13 [Candidatus Woesearchaeota archaeon]
MAEEQKIKHIVRIANTDLKGEKAISVALTRIRGVGTMFSNMVCKISGIDGSKKAGLLDAREIERLTDIISNPEKYKVPEWMMNRRQDIETGDDKHIITGDLQFTEQQDVRRLQKIRSYRGFRHASGLPSRGQRTKSNFRRNKGKAVGVKKKSGAKSGRV